MKACQILSVQFSCWWLVVKILFCCWQDTEQRLLRLAVDALAATQEEVKSARAAVRFAEEQWQQAIRSKDREQESKWKQEVKEAEQKVEKAEQKVEKAKQEVQARASPTVEARWL